MLIPEWGFQSFFDNTKWNITSIENSSLSLTSSLEYIVKSLPNKYILKVSVSLILQHTEYSQLNLQLGEGRNRLMNVGWCGAKGRGVSSLREKIALGAFDWYFDNESWSRLFVFERSFCLQVWHFIKIKTKKKSTAVFLCHTSSQVWNGKQQISHNFSM